MTPGACVEAAIGLLSAIDEGRQPADDIVEEHFRRHRFAGVKDRGSISEHVFAVLRHRASLDWWIAREGRGLAADARRRTLAALVLIAGWAPERIAKEFDGDRFRPARLDDFERRLTTSLSGRDLADRAMPEDVRGNYPAWLAPHFAAALGRDVGRAMAAAAETAPLDLRVNLLKSDREAARAALAREGSRRRARHSRRWACASSSASPLDPGHVQKRRGRGAGRRFAARVADGRCAAGDARR